MPKEASRLKGINTTLHEPGCARMAQDVRAVFAARSCALCYTLPCVTDVLDRHLSVVNDSANSLSRIGFFPSPQAWQ